jgi:hypothetical protein
MIQLGKFGELDERGQKQQDVNAPNDDFRKNKIFIVEEAGGLEKNYVMTTLGKKTEVPSTSCEATARGLAKFAAFMANKGSFGGKQLISEATWTDAHSEPVTRIETSGSRTNFTKGGYSQFGIESFDKSVKYPDTEWYTPVISKIMED